MTITTKFSIGDEVWFIHKDKAVKQKIFSIHVSGLTQSAAGTAVNDFYGGIDYNFDYPEPSPMQSCLMGPERIKKDESCCFATREELIASL